jgi:hypothetical protein
MITIIAAPPAWKMFYHYGSDTSDFWSLYDLSGFDGLLLSKNCLLNPLNGEPIEGSERGYGLSREADFGTQPDYQQCIYPDDEYAELFADGWMPAAKHL